MTTKTISTYIAAGYVLSTKYSAVKITSTGGVGGTGLAAYAYTDVFNYGQLHASGISGYGLKLNAGGDVANRPGGVITNGVESFAYARIYNGGQINDLADIGGLQLLGGGDVSNYSGTIKGGFIRLGAAGVVHNGGSIRNAGIYLAGGGTVTNGYPGNEATISDATRDVDFFTAGASTLSNYGTIVARQVHFYGGASLTNGSAGVTDAEISGYDGVRLDGVATATNFGTIAALGGGYYPAGGPAGVQLNGGGRLANGSAVDRTALIHGYYGVLAKNDPATVINSGTVRGDVATGVKIEAGGSLVNGSLNNHAALIEGYTGVSLAGAASASNFGTILGLGEAGSFGAYLAGGQSLVNGAAGQGVAASIYGFEGVGVGGTTAATVTNFGAIGGAGGTAVAFASAADVLVVEGGCAFEGAVLGGGGTLDLDTGTGTLAGAGSGGVTVSGSMAQTLFQDFDTLLIGPAANFSQATAVTIAANQSIGDAGLLTLGGKGKNSIVNRGILEVGGSGTLTLAGAVTGAGRVQIAGGLLDCASSFNQAVSFTGATGTLELAQSQSYSGTISGFSKSGKTSFDLDDIAFGKATTATYSGTKKGGVLTVTDGTHTATISLKGNYLSSTFIAASDGHGGTLVHDPAAPVAPPHRLIAAMAGLAASGADTGWTRRDVWRATPAGLARPRAAAA